MNIFSPTAKTGIAVTVFLLAGVLLAVLAPVMIASGRPELISSAFMAPPAWLIGGVAGFIQIADRSWPPS